MLNLDLDNSVKVVYDGLMFKDAEFFNEDFHASDLRRVDFTRAEFTNCDFRDCNFEKADFLGAIFTNCDFRRCNFNSYLTGVRFTNCDFVECEFDNAYIFRAQFKNCDLTLCNMTNALLSTVDFTNTDFEAVCWHGTIINSPPLIVDGIEYPVVALDNGWMHVGCEFNTMDWFWNTDEKYSASMEGLRARRFWKRNKRWIFDMLVARKLYVYPENR